jgi:hypothetical protein
MRRNGFLAEDREGGQWGHEEGEKKNGQREVDENGGRPWLKSVGSQDLRV